MDTPAQVGVLCSVLGQQHFLPQPDIADLAARHVLDSCHWAPATGLLRGVMGEDAPQKHVALLCSALLCSALSATASWLDIPSCRCNQPL